MEPEDFIKNKKVLLMGLGVLGGGVATSQWLIKHQAKLTITDLKTKEELKDSLSKLKPFLHRIKLVLGEHREKDFQTNDIIVVNPSVIIKNNHFLAIAKKKTTIITSDLGLFLKFSLSPIIAITGTRGKTTTATWLTQLLNQKYPAFLAGNIPQNPALSLLDKIKPESPVVLEISSFQLELLNRIKPKIAIITNLFTDHLNRYGAMKQYAKTKARIFKNQDKNDYLILNYDNQWTKYFLSLKPKSKIYFISHQPLPLNKNGIFFKNNKLYFQENKKIIGDFSIKDFFEKQGRHNLENFMFAALAGNIFGLSLKQIEKGSEMLPQIKFRQEVVYRNKNLMIINDSAATSPEATQAALERFKKENLYLITGGTDKNLDFNNLAKKINQCLPTKHLILLEGSATEKLIKELKKENYSKKYFLLNSLEECLKQTFSLISRHKKTVILFSPASASFEKFQNEFDRGEKFNQLIINYFF